MRRLLPAALASITLVFGCAATPSAKSDDQSPDDIDDRAERQSVQSAMVTEMKRSMDRLRIEDYESPYFVAYQIKDTREINISGKFGAIVQDTKRRNRQSYVEVRVGDYEFDNHANVDTQNFRFNAYNPGNLAPLDPNPTAIRGVLWQLTDQAYKSALSNYKAKRGGAVFQAEQKADVGSFSREEPHTYTGERESLSLAVPKWKEIVRRTTDKILEFDHLLDASVDVGGRRITRYFVNSEGSRIIDERMLYSVRITAYTRAEDGMLLDNGRTFYALSADALPTESEVLAATDEMLGELKKLRTAPVIDPYTGPAILAPEASGVLFHEAIGHRLEGERQRNDQGGQTFKDQVGSEIIPSFLSVYDDPTKRRLADHQLNGFYKYDDEGVPAQRVTLVEDGVLKNFLKSRTPIEGSPQSNGHGRAQGTQTPMGRMANTIVEANDDHTYSRKQLKQRLMKEAREQGKPFGLIISDITGGSTNTSGFGYQAFKGSPRLIYKVDPKTGEETLVRGAELVGTPLTSINKIVAASDTRDVFNGYCGAESGYVPVSAVAPALLTTEIELQRTRQKKERQPLLTPPWESGTNTAPSDKSNDTTSSTDE
jgi:predicted Zn-dependent protease